MGYPVAAVRSKNFGSSIIPWWLTGGIAQANCLAAYQPKGAANLATSYVNLAHPGVSNAAPGTAPTWDSTNGWKFNGSTQYLDTLALGVSQDVSFIIRFSSLARPGGYVGLMGFNGGGGRGHYLYLVNTADTEISNGSYITPSCSQTYGTLGCAGKDFYANGVKTGVDIATATWTDGVVTIGKINTNFGDFYAQAVSFYNTTLTAAQMLAVSSAMAAL
jgi:hypothetical protein